MYIFKDKGEFFEVIIPDYAKDPFKDTTDNISISLILQFQLNDTVKKLDVNYEDVYSKASLITPPVGAVGPMTICMLAYNCAKAVYGEEINEVLEQGIEKAKVLIKTIEFK